MKTNIDIAQCITISPKYELGDLVSSAELILDWFCEPGLE